MSARAGHFQSALGALLAANILEVDGKMLRLTQQLIAVYFKTRDAIAGIDEVNDIQQ